MHDRDPIANCLTRHAFLEQIAEQFDTAQQNQHNLACLLFDIDGLASINRRFGSHVGDHALENLAAVAANVVGQEGAVGRFYDDTLIVSVPGADSEVADRVAELVRQQGSGPKQLSAPLTIHTGIACRSGRAANPLELIGQAQHALHCAKQTESIQPIVWDRLPGQHSEQPRGINVDVRAVYSLFSVLVFRSFAVANHCRRVADACAIAAHDRCPVDQLVALECAALLHEIGQVGLPDELLEKTGPLTTVERQVVSFHQQLGADTLKAAFGHPLIDECLVTVHSCHDRHHSPPSSTAADVLVIADTFDRLTHDRLGRRLLTDSQGLQELEKMSGYKLDGTLVSEFSSRISQSAERQGTSSSESPLDAFKFQQNVCHEFQSLRHEFEAVQSSSVAALDQICLR